jgi:prephenate dehydrogenase
MTNSVVIVGLGEIGSVFARGFLRSGFTVQSLSVKPVWVIN